MNWGEEPGMREPDDWSDRLHELLYGAVRNIAIAWGLTAIAVIAVRSAL